MSFTQKDAAYEQIRWMIVTLGLQPGALVDEKELTNRLNIGRTPVREALQRLGALERLVVIRPRQGTYVSEITLTDFDELVEARALLEGQAARLAAVRISDDRLAKMKALLEETEQLGSVLTPDQAIKFDRLFHGHIAHACGNKYLQDSFAIIQPFILRLIYFCLDKNRVCGRHNRESSRSLLSLRTTRP